MRLVVAVALCASACLAGCGALGASPTPTPRPLPTSAPTPAVTAEPTVDPATADIQDAFLTNVNDLTSEVETLATAACPDLTAETTANPTEIADIHGFASTMQRIGTQQPSLNSDDVRSSLNDLNQALSQLDAALKTCGIQTTP